MMRHRIGFALCLFFPTLLTGCAGPDDAYETPEPISQEIWLDTYGALPPEGWIEEPPVPKVPTMGMDFRHAVFELPRAPGAAEDAELIISKGASGREGIDANLERWKNMFEPPKGKTLDELAKIEDVTLGEDLKGKKIDITAHYKEKPFPMAQNFTLQREWRMIGLHLNGPRNVYHIKLVGPKETVAKHEKDFDQWLRSFKKKNPKEKQ